jgi:hypothetical protein
MAHNAVVMVKVHGCRRVDSLKPETNGSVFLNVASGTVSVNRFVVTGMQKRHRRHFIPSGFRRQIDDDPVRKDGFLFQGGFAWKREQEKDHPRCHDP